MPSTVHPLSFFKRETHWVLPLAILGSTLTSLGYYFAPNVLLGLGIMAALIAVLFTMKAVFQRLPILSPAFVIPSFMVIYYGIGSLNISTYRGEVSPKTLQLASAAILSFLIGCWAMRFLHVCAPPRSRRIEWDEGRLNAWTVLCLGIGALSVLSVCALYGIPLLGSQARFEVSPYLAFLSGLSWIGPLFYFVDSLWRPKPPLKIIAVMSLGCLLVTLLGYRTPLAMFMCASLVSFGLAKGLSWARAASSVAVIVAVISLFYFARMNLVKEGGDVGTTDALLETYEAPKWLGPFLTVYFTCREGTAIFDRIHTYAPEEGLYFGSLALADLITILPGEQVSGGAMVAALVGGTGIAGLTPSILGAFYLDWGILGMILAPAILGFFLTSLYARAMRCRDRESIIIYALVLAYSIQFVHRGVFAAQYVFDVGILVLGSFLIRSSGKAGQGTKKIPVIDTTSSAA